MPMKRTRESAIVVTVFVDRRELVHRFRASGRGEITLGRAADRDVPQLPDASRRHGRLLFEGGRLVGYEDTSSFGTLVGEEPVRGRTTALSEGQLVTIGGATLFVEIDHAPTVAEERGFLEALEASPSDRAVRLVFADWLEAEGRIEEADFLRVGDELACAPPGPDRLAALPAGAARMLPAVRRAMTQAPIERCESLALAIDGEKDERYEARCPKRWSLLDPTDDPSVRHCTSCDEPVYYVMNVDVARVHAYSGRRVCVDPCAAPRRRFDLLVEARARGGFEFTPHVREVIVHDEGGT